LAYACVRKVEGVSCYFVAQIKIHDRDEYQKYLDGFDEVFSKYKGVVMAVDDNPEILEGEWSFPRTVLIRFPDEAEARRWYESPEYKELVRHRHRASEGNLVLVRGRK
jgi:uncharacterized protein (DUF1330 family)